MGESKEDLLGEDLGLNLELDTDSNVFSSYIIL